MNSPISVFQIYFDDYTKKYLEEGFKPYFNTRKDGYFENTVFKDIYEEINATSESFGQASKYIGISSWKQSSKTHLSGKEIISHIEKDIALGIEKDIYLYPPIATLEYNYENVPEGYYSNGIIKAPDIWTQHKAWGEEVYKADVLLNNANVLPFNIFDGKWMFSHCNYWIAKKEIFNEYCENVLIPSIAFFEREDIKQLTPAWHTHEHEKKKYPSYSFVMEGLPGSFFAHKEYSFSYICKKNINKRAKKRKIYNMINIIGYKQIGIKNGK